MPPRDAREAARRSYVRTHWGHPGDEPDRALVVADPSEHFFAVLGELDSLTYEAAKGRFSRANLWQHEFGTPRPVLCYSPTSGLLVIAGGRYTVTRRGIEG